MTNFSVAYIKIVEVMYLHHLYMMHGYIIYTTQMPCIIYGIDAAQGRYIHRLTPISVHVYDTSSTHITILTICYVGYHRIIPTGCFTLRENINMCIYKL